jgi:ribosomal protein S17E
MGFIKAFQPFDIFAFCTEVGGVWVAMSFFFVQIVKIMNPDAVVYTMVKTFFRKPSLYKFAKAEKLDYNMVIKQEMTLAEFNRRQLELNLQAMNKRTTREIDGHISRKTLRNTIAHFFTKYCSRETNMMFVVDRHCYEVAKEKIENEMLDVHTIISESRQNMWLKDMILTKTQIVGLE